ncbi:MAG: beta-galactosidase, partial [Planctomycetes bacterium]|nr:beta-galactosidase [Planctomycetota bacterium]
MTTLEHPRIIVRLVVCCTSLHLATAVWPGATCPAAETVDSPEASQRGAAPAEGFTYLGKISPRHARDIKSSNWAVGAETMGREYTIYANWRKYLGPLGAKRARIQSGWAKTEQEKGKYDWAWLDEIIPDMIEQGVQPWVCLCYGNPIYPGGGGTGLGGG